MAMAGVKKVIEHTKLKKQRNKVKKKKERTVLESYEDEAFILSYQVDTNVKEIGKLLTEVEELEKEYQDCKEKKRQESAELLQTVERLPKQWQEYQLNCEDAEEKIQLQIEAVHAKAKAAVTFAQTNLQLLQQKVSEVVSLVEEKEELLAQCRYYVAEERQNLDNKIELFQTEIAQIKQNFELDRAFIRSCLQQCREGFARMTDEDIQRIKQDTLDAGIEHLSPLNWKVLLERHRLKYEVRLQTDEINSLSQQIKLVECNTTETTKKLLSLKEKLWKIVPLPSWPETISGCEQGPVLNFTSKTTSTEDLFSFEHQFCVPHSMETVLKGFPVAAAPVNPANELNTLSVKAVRGTYVRTCTDLPVPNNTFISTAHYQH